jgi:hypothetical protein
MTCLQRSRETLPQNRALFRKRSRSQKKYVLGSDGIAELPDEDFQQMRGGMENIHSW